MGQATSYIISYATSQIHNRTHTVEITINNLWKIKKIESILYEKKTH